MNKFEHIVVLVYFAVGCGGVYTANAQFFPTEQAAWCLSRNHPEGTDDYTLSMVPGQDTVIQGLTYMVIEYTTEWTPTMELWPFSRCYVRNDQDGRGFLRVEGFDMEVLAGDVDVQVGEIVPDVAVDSWYCGNSWEAGTLTDMIVDSIVDMQENGIQARRVYVQPLCFPAASATISFWQTGMGTPFGPFLMLNELSTANPVCAAVNDTTRFRLFEELQLGGPLCYCYDLGLGTITLDQAPSLAYWPNPSQGVFRIPSPGSWPLAVYDLHGREVQRLLPYSVEIDLSAQPPGVHTAIIQSPHGRSVQRLVVVRE